MLNDWALPKMSQLGVQCAGHEGAGVIVKVGANVKTLKPGMRAGLKVWLLLLNSTTPALGSCAILTLKSLSKTRAVPANSAVTATNATAPTPS